MSDNRMALTEIYLGHVLKGLASPFAVKPEDLPEPYPQMLKLMRKGTKDPETLMTKCGIQPVRTVIEAAKNSKGLPVDWPKAIEVQAARDRSGAQLRKMADRLTNGGEVDVAKLISLAHSLDEREDAREMVPLSDISRIKTAFVPCGFKPFDVHFGGLPKQGMIVIAGPTGVGKTSLGIDIGSAHLRTDKKSVFHYYSLEMSRLLFALRTRQSKKLPSALEKRFFVCDTVYGVEDLQAIASRSDDATLICIDFAELLLNDDTSEAVMAGVYLAVSKMARRLDIPIILLAQLNRSYQGGIPHVHNIRYSGMAEILSSLITLVYNPSQIYAGKGTDDDEVLIKKPGTGYLVFGKSRYGWGKHDGPGAVELKWDGAETWRETPNVWHSLKATHYEV